MTADRVLPRGLTVELCPACGGPVFWATTPDGKRRFMLDGRVKVAAIAVSEHNEAMDTNPITGEPTASPSVGGFALHGMVCEARGYERE